MIWEGGAAVVDIILASTNRGKRQEFEELIALFGAMEIQLHGPPVGAPEIDETGRSYVANARLKADAYCLKYTSPALGDDSGLAVDAMDGAPALRTARFWGPGLTASERVDRLQQRMQGVPAEQRGAHFVCALYLAFPDGTAVTAHGLVHGRIAAEPRGAHGFGYDPIFLLPQLGQTMAELAPAQKHRLSHRGHAMRSLLHKLRQRTHPTGQS